MANTFKTHLLEARDTVELDEVLTEIDSNCQRFLRESNGLPLYRGINNSMLKPFKGQIRTNREPRHSSREHHTFFNLLLSTVAGIWNVRSMGLFATGSLEVAQAYDRPHVIFPIGNYDFIWSRHIDDLFTGATVIYSLIANRLSTPDWPLSELLVRRAVKVLFEEVPDVETAIKMPDKFDNKCYELFHIPFSEFTDICLEIGEELYQMDKMNAAIASGHEITIFICPGYYAIPVKLLTDPTQYQGKCSPALWRSLEAVSRQTNNVFR